MDISRGYGSFSKALKQQRKASIFQKGSTVVHTCLRYLTVSKKNSDGQNLTTVLHTVLSWKCKKLYEAEVYQECSKSHVFKYCVSFIMNFY